MPSPTKRPAELTRLYWVVALLALITVAFLAYKAISPQVGTGMADGPSRWALPAVGLANALAIGTLLFIVARSLVKLWFERRSGILGARLRTRLVVALFAIGVIPSLLLFIVGQKFIAKNVERWFSPETEEVIVLGKSLADQARSDLQSRLDFGIARVLASASAEPLRMREESGLDLVGRLVKAGFEAGGPTLGEHALDGRLTLPILTTRPADGDILMLPEGMWRMRVVKRGDGEWLGGIFMPMAQVETLHRLEQRHRESVESRRSRESLETIPQSTFLFLTVLTLFFAVWTGLTLAKSLSEPIRALAKAAQRVGGGDLEVHLQEVGSDELAFLARSFNGMTKDLKTSREALVAQTGRLDQQRAYLDQLLAALPVGVLSWRADGELRVVNAAARTWLGLSEIEVAEGWEKLGASTRLGRLPDMLEGVRARGVAATEELRLGGEGEGRPIRVMLLPLKGGGQLALLEDLSLLAQAEKRAAWQEVARRMAHEVKNPLTPIQLTAQRLLRKGREGKLDPESVREGAETILTEVGSLARLVDSFSRFARLPQPQFAPVDARELVLQVAALYQPNHPGVAWDVKVPEHPLGATWDGDMVKRALINYVDNALGALEGEGGEARGSLRIALEDQGGTATLRVEDDGPGVAPENRERLFEPAFTTKRKGSGLGLAIVRRIAQDHGGEVGYEPLNPGSRFLLRLPLGARAASG
ncbi:MAG: HAMP domain-containing protein [Acidobacteria bacterium]|nr:HAMP domain-containing protein [Acidobacteriota bacterium]